MNLSLKAHFTNKYVEINNPKIITSLFGVGEKIG
jgi:hypothetical protein